MRFWSALGILVTMGACASVVGLGDYEIVETEGVDGAAIADAGTTLADALVPVADAKPESSVACRCAAAPPDGWTFVRYAGDRSAPCPSGLATSDLVGEPISATCSCAACSITAPSCTSGSFSTRFDTSGAPQCDQPSSLSFPAKNGDCVHYGGGTLADHSRVVPPAPSGGSCKADGAIVSSGITAKNVRVCSGDGACACEGPSPYASCIRAPGAQACPAAYPTKQVVGVAVTASCDPCACELENAKCSATVTFYADNSCGVPRATINDAECKAISGPGGFASLKYQGEGSATCKTTAAVAKNVALTEPSTICCP